MYIRLLILLASIANVRLLADAVTFTTSEGNGMVSYLFTLTNTGVTGGTVFDLFLHLPTGIGNIDTAVIGTPVGWGDASGGLLFFGPDVDPSTSFIEWASDFSGAHDVAIGDALSGFSFVATQPVGMPITFALNGSTEFFTAQEVTTTIPEPGPLIPLVALVAALGFRLRFKPAAKRRR
jgi:hypothetical protein